MKIVKYCLALLPLTVGVVGIYSVLRPAPTQQATVVATNNTSQQRYVDEQELWTLIANYKQENSLQIPTKDESLCAISKMRLGVIADNWSHDGFTGNWKFEIAPGFDQISENLSSEYQSAFAVLDGWINSPPHKEILLKDYSKACVQCANIDGTNYCVYISGV